LHTINLELTHFTEYASHINKFTAFVITIGGASVVSYSFRHKFFGRTIKAIEYPDGDLTTVQFKGNKLEVLKSLIMKEQPAPYPGIEFEASDIKHMALFVPPSFTEPILKDKDLKKLETESWIFWTRLSEGIPRQGVTLTTTLDNVPEITKISDSNEINKAIKYISGSKNDELTKEDKEYIIDLLVDRNADIFRIWQLEKQDENRFLKKVQKLLQKTRNQTSNL